MVALYSVDLVRHGMVRFRVPGGPVVYVDPFQLEKAPHDADLIVVTHSHSDHFSPDDLRKAAAPNTCFAVTAPVADWLVTEMRVNPAYISLLVPGAPAQMFECGVALTPLPAENSNHPQGFGFGALLEMGGFSYYVAGDTDVLSDVACDALFVPCDGLYNMLHYMDQIPEQLAAMDHKPGVVVPYHYGGYMEGTDENGPRLAEKLKGMGIHVQLLCRP